MSAASIRKSKVENVGLEEIKLDDRSDVWRITIAFSRPWDRQLGFAGAKAGGLIPLREKGYVVESGQVPNA